MKWFQSQLLIVVVTEKTKLQRRLPEEPQGDAGESCCNALSFTCVVFGDEYSLAIRMLTLNKA